MIRRLPELHAATTRIDNRAVFEVPELLADLMVQRPRVAHWRPARTAQLSA
jgi:hypothetical protein